MFRMKFTFPTVVVVLLTNGPREHKKTVRNHEGRKTFSLPNFPKRRVQFDDESKFATKYGRPQLIDVPNHRNSCGCAAIEIRVFRHPNDTRVLSTFSNTVLSLSPSLSIVLASNLNNTYQRLSPVYIPNLRTSMANRKRTHACTILGVYGAYTIHTRGLTAALVVPFDFAMCHAN